MGTLYSYRQYQTLPDFALPLLGKPNLPSSNETVMIIAPHSDDETLGAAGYIKQSLDNHARVIVVLMTNGDGHRFSTIEEFNKAYPGANDYINSGYTRQKESENALSVLGLSPNNIIFLGYPDGGLLPIIERHWSENSLYRSQYTKSDHSPYNNSFAQDAAYYGENIFHNIEKLVSLYEPSIVISPNENDENPDHRATAIFVNRVLGELQIKPINYTYLVHFSRYPQPFKYRPDNYLSPPARLISGDSSWYSLSLDKNSEDRKDQAVKAYSSQIKVPLLKTLMESLVRKNEIFSEKIHK